MSLSVNQAYYSTFSLINFDLLIKICVLNKNIDYNIEYVSRKISKVIILLRKLKFIVSFGVFISVFNAHILSNWMYGSFVWEHDSNVKKVVMLQKRGMRICCGFSRCHCIPLLKTPTSTYRHFCVCFSMFNVCQVKFNNQPTPKNSLIHNHITRLREDLRISQCNFLNKIRSHLKLCQDYTIFRYLNF